MKTLILSFSFAALALTGCVETSPTQNTMLGALGGAAAGAAVSSHSDRGKGALIGAALGAAAASQVKTTDNSQRCIYRNAAGQSYYAAC